MGLPEISTSSQRADLGASRMEVYDGDRIFGIDEKVDKVIARFLSKTHGRPTLRRSEFDPLDFAEQMPKLDIYDFGSPRQKTDNTTNMESVTVRFSGSEISAFYGEFTGEEMHDIKPAEASGRAMELCRIIKSRKSPIVAVVTPCSERSPLSNVTALFMPLTDEFDGVDGACVYHVFERRNRPANSRSESTPPQGLTP